MNRHGAVDREGLDTPFLLSFDYLLFDLGRSVGGCSMIDLALGRVITVNAMASVVSDPNYISQF